MAECNNPRKYVEKYERFEDLDREADNWIDIFESWLYDDDRIHKEELLRDLQNFKNAELKLIKELLEKILDEVLITTNKQIIPDDPNPPLKPSGIRLGTPCATTRGMGKDEVEKIGNWILKTLKNSDNETVKEKIKKEVEEICLQYPVPGI